MEINLNLNLITCRNLLLPGNRQCKKAKAGQVQCQHIATDQSLRGSHFWSLPPFIMQGAGGLPLGYSEKAKKLAWKDF